MIAACSILNLTAAEDARIQARWANVPGKRLQSFNFQDRYVRHANFDVRIDQNITGPDAQFRPRPGLVGSGTVSFESVNFPGYFLRHADFGFQLAYNDGTTQFAQDATFRQVAGLADPAWSSFQSYNYPTHYIRHYAYQLKVGSIQPIGSPAGNAGVGGREWQVWSGSNGMNDVLSFVAPSAISSWTFDVMDFVRQVAGANVSYWPRTREARNDSSMPSSTPVTLPPTAPRTAPPGVLPRRSCILSSSGLRISRNPATFARIHPGRSTTRTRPASGAGHRFCGVAITRGVGWDGWDDNRVGAVGAGVACPGRATPGPLSRPWSCSTAAGGRRWGSTG
ncbi:AbfB domain-containing protein [Streptomyces dysideae]|uniref:Alpha-L-arabinofuranosidase B arabinose-binding domain-containing protein n=1 Tax=Streptomyces dysideae TaxID=909626 RepID=A0A101UQ36_9ACTN|nr:hypothetical protein AQJ91_44895 [Streptomyces dysideae]